MSKNTEDEINARRLSFVLANGLPIEIKGQYRCFGYWHLGWFGSAIAAIDAALKEKK